MLPMDFKFILASGKKLFQHQQQQNEICDWFPFVPMEVFFQIACMSDLD